MWWALKEKLKLENDFMCELCPCGVLWNMYVPSGVVSSNVGGRLRGRGHGAVVNGKLEDDKGSVVVGE